MADIDEKTRILSPDSTIQIPGYTLDRRLGSGAMATVYLAIQQSLERPVALKLMAASLVADETFRERFLKEGKIIGKLSHPHIVTVYDIGVYQSCYYIAMECINGGTLKERIQQGLSMEQSVEIIREVASALGYAHQHGFVHRDVKPANILFRENGMAVLSDFGIAKAMTGGATQLTAAGWTVGTPNYMSPEQALGKSVGAQSDLYSLGVVFYEMLTGAKPYQSEDSFSIALMHVNDPIPNLPRKLTRYQDIIDRLLAKTPEDRFGSAEELINTLEEIGKHREVLANRNVSDRVIANDTAPIVLQKSPRWLLGLGLLIPLAGISLYLFWPTSPSPKPPENPEVIAKPDPSISVTPTDSVIPTDSVTPIDSVTPTDSVTSIDRLDNRTRGEVESLLAVAEVHMEAGYFTEYELPGANAAENYRRVLELDPLNSQAQKGLEAIANHYAKLARENLQGGNAEASRELVNIALTLAPDHAELRTLREQLGQ